MLRFRIHEIEANLTPLALLLARARAREGASFIQQLYLLLSASIVSIYRSALRCGFDGATKLEMIANATASLLLVKSGTLPQGSLQVGARS